MHRRAQIDGGFEEWPNGKGVPPRLCRVTGFQCQSDRTVEITKLIVMHRCGDCGRKWFTRADDVAQ